MKTKPQLPVNEPFMDLQSIPVVTYVRVSLVRMDHERQYTDISLYCKRNNYVLIQSFEEKISGLKDEKLVLNQCLDYIDKHNIKYIIISELSRLGRTKEVLNIIDVLNKKKICLISLKEGVKTLNEDKTINFNTSLLINVLSGINTFEVDSLKYRIISGLKTSANKGHAGGSSHLPYGYKKEGKLLIMDENESEVINKIFELYIQGFGTSKIARYLNDNNVKNRSQKIKESETNKTEIKYRCKWVDGTIYCILINSIYIGKRNFKGEVLDQPQLRIISDETFITVQIMLKNHTTKQNINRKYDYYIDNNKLVCGVCGKHYHMIIKYDKNKVLKDNRYVCISKRMLEDCKNIGIGINKLNKVVQNIILLVFDNEFIKGINSDENVKGIEDKKIEIEKLSKDLRTLELKEKKYVDLYINEMISKSLYQENFKQITNDKKKIENNTKKLNIEINDINRSMKNISDIKKIYKEYSAGNVLNKEVVNKIIDKIVITKTIDEHFKNFDNVVRLDIWIGGRTFPVLISQHSNNFLMADYKDMFLPLNINFEKFDKGTLIKTNN